MYIHTYDYLGIFLSIFWMVFQKQSKTLLRHS